MNTDNRAKARFMTKATAGFAAVTAGVLGIWAGALAACRQESADAFAPESPQAYGAQRYDEAHRVNISFDRVEALTTEGQTTALKLYFGGGIDGVDLTAGSVRIVDRFPGDNWGGVGTGINKGRVYHGGEARCYVVEVDNVRTNGTVMVEVKKGGYRFVPEELPVEVQGNIDTPTIELRFVSVTQNGSPDKATTEIYLEFEGPEHPPLGDEDCLPWAITTALSPGTSWYVAEGGDKVVLTRTDPWLVAHLPVRGIIRLQPLKNGLHFTPESIEVEVFPWVEGRDVDPGVLPWPLDYLTQQDGAQARAQRSGARTQRSATPRRDGTPGGSDSLPTLRQAP